jgi:hypothetical protein
MNAKLLGRTLVLVPAVPIAASLLFFAANLAAVSWADRAAIRRAAHAAFEAGEFRLPRTTPLDRRGPLNPFNDCLILTMIMTEPQAAWIEALSPRFFESARYPTPCEHARFLAAGGRVETPEAPLYHRYLFGPRAAASVLLSHADVPTARALLRGGAYALLGAVLLVVAWRRVRGVPMPGNAPREADGFLAAVAAGLALAYGIPFFGMSLGFGVSDLPLYAFLLAAALVNLAALPPAALGVAAASFGAVVGYFEFLTGQAPLGLALLLGVIAVQAPAGMAAVPGALWSRAGGAAIAFSVGLLGCFAIKFLAVAAVFGGAEARNALASLAYRMGGGIAAESPWLAQHAAGRGFDLTAASAHAPDTVAFLATYLARWAPVLGQGSRVLGQALLLLGLLGLAAGAGAGFAGAHGRRPGRRARLWLLLASAAVVPAWYLIFLNHSVIHADFMVRPLAYPTVVGLWLGLGALAPVVTSLAWRGRRPPPEAATQGNGRTPPAHEGPTASSPAP